MTSLHFLRFLTPPSPLSYIGLWSNVTILHKWVTSFMDSPRLETSSNMYFFPLLVHNNELKCSASGQALKSQNPDREVNFYKGEEESYADASNQLMNVGSTKNALQFLTSIIVVVFALKIIA